MSKCEIFLFAPFKIFFSYLRKSVVKSVWLVEYRDYMQTECCLLLDERLLCVQSRIHMLQVMAEGLFASDSCPFCEEKYGLDSVISVWGFFLVKT